jgi:CysZ protein
LLKELIIAIESYFKAHRFIVKHKLWKWILIPGIIYMLLFVTSMYFFGKSATAVIAYLTQDIEKWVQNLHNSFIGFLFVLAGAILWLLLMLFYFSLFKYIFLIIGSPVFAYLSEKTESIMEGKEYPFNSSQLLKDIVRGIRIALRNTLWQTVYSISILILSFIPVIGWATPLLALFIECYYYGFSMLDYSCERHKLSATESIDFIGNHKGLAIGNGMVFYIMHLIPFLGWVLAPAYAVIAATISIYHQKEDI